MGMCAFHRSRHRMIVQGLRRGALRAYCRGSVRVLVDERDTFFLDRSTLLSNMTLGLAHEVFVRGPPSKAQTLSGPLLFLASAPIATHKFKATVFRPSHVEL